MTKDVKPVKIQNTIVPYVKATNLQPLQSTVYVSVRKIHSGLPKLVNNVIHHVALVPTVIKPVVLTLNIQTLMLKVKTLLWITFSFYQTMPELFPRKLVKNFLKELKIQRSKPLDNISTKKSKKSSKLSTKKKKLTLVKLLWKKRPLKKKEKTELIFSPNSIIPPKKQNQNRKLSSRKTDHNQVTKLLQFQITRLIKLQTFQLPWRTLSTELKPNQKNTLFIWLFMILLTKIKSKKSKNNSKMYLMKKIQRLFP